MAKDWKKSIEDSAEMTLEEAKAWRKSLHVEKPKILTDEQKREEFRVFWAQEKAKYGKGKELENILWTHLKSMGLNSPEKFVEGLQHFGLKKKK